MKKVLFTMAILVICHLQFSAQIKQISNDEVKHMQPKEVIEPYNYDKPTYDSLSNGLSNYSNIIGQRLFFAKKTKFAYPHIREDNVKRKFEFSRLITSQSENTSGHETENFISDIDIIEVSYGIEMSDVYMTLIDVIVPKDNRFIDYFKSIETEKYDKNNSCMLKYNRKGVLVFLEKYYKRYDLTYNKVSLNKDSIPSIMIGFKKEMPKEKSPKKMNNVLSYAISKQKANRANNKEDEIMWSCDYEPIDKPFVLTKNEINKLQEPHNPIFVLVEENTKDTLYVQESLGICVGFFEKMVKLHKGKTYITVGDGYHGINAFDNKAMYLPPNKEYLCKDVVVYKGRVVGVLTDNDIDFGFNILSANPLEYVNATQKQTYASIPTKFHYVEDNIKIYSAIDKYEYGDFNKDYNSGLRPLDFYKIDNAYRIKLKEHIANYNKKSYEKSKAEYEATIETFNTNVITKYGKEYGNKILRREVAIGMNKEMCIVAWGAPARIQTVDTGVEILYYSSLKWIKLVNGKVTEFLE